MRYLYCLREHTRSAVLLSSPKSLGFSIHQHDFGRAKEISRVIHLTFALKIGHMSLVYSQYVQVYYRSVEHYLPRL
jgi:hypothetical protein